MGKKKERKGIVILIDQMKLVEEAFEPLERAEMYSAVFQYATEGRLPQGDKFSRSWKAIFNILRAAQDESKENYEQMCERNREIADNNKKMHSASTRPVSSPVVTSRDESSPVETSRDQDKIREDKRREENIREENDCAFYSDQDMGVTGVGWL